MVRSRGFTLIELVMASFVATCGLVLVASMFSFAIRANSSNRQMAVATALLYDKMEQFKSTPLDSVLWTDGSDDVVQETTFTRIWQIDKTSICTVTIIVYAEGALTRRPSELIRATTIMTNMF